MNPHPCIALLLLSALRLLGQSPPVERIGVEQGLSQGFVTCLLQDREGFIWAGTFNGLNRYDGYRFRLFSHDPFDSLTLSTNNIASLCDAGDYLLVGTLGNGLNIFHKKTKQFFRLPCEPEERAGAPATAAYGGRRLPGNTVSQVLKDGLGDYWIFNFQKILTGGWISKMEVPKDFWQQLPNKPELLAQVKFHSWRVDNWNLQVEMAALMLPPLIINGNQLLCIKRDETVAFNYQEQTWKPLPPPTPKAGNIWNFIWSDEQAASLRQAEDGITWHCTEGGGCTQVAGVRGRILHFDAELIWVRDGGFIYAYRHRKSPFSIDFSSPYLQIAVNDKRTIFHFDRSGNFWFAEGADGLAKYCFNAGRFRHYFKGASLPSPPSVTPGGCLFYAGGTSGLHFHGKPDKGLQTLQQMLRSNHLIAQRVLQDGKGNYWMPFNRLRAPTHHTFLIKSNALTGSAKTYELPYRTNYFNDAAFDEAGALWFSVEEALICFNPSTEKWKAFDYKGLGLKDNPVFSMAKTADGSWWLATMVGLVQAKPEIGNPPGADGKLGNSNGSAPAIQPSSHSAIQQFDFQLFITNPKDRNSLRSSNIASLLTDPNDPFLLWIGTKGGGLNRLDTRTNQFNHLTTKEGLPDNVIYGILPDGGGNLWLSSNRGLIRYKPATGEMKNYRKADGLQSDEFNTFSYAKGLNGDPEGSGQALMFGGVNGLNVFNPKDLTDNPAKPNVSLTGLKINNLPIETGDTSGILPEAIEFCKHIVLPFSRNSVTLEFAALEFAAPSKNRFRYWLEGLEKAYSHEGYEPQAAYLNLPPGSYTFIVYGSNNDGVWSEQPARLEIRVLPPWYRTWLAYLVYSLLIGGFVFWIYRYRAMQRAMKMQEKEARHEQEIHRLKLEEFAQRLLEKTKLIEELQYPRRVNGDADENNAAALPSDFQAEQFPTSILTKSDWENFQALFERVHPGFLHEITKHFPQLSGAEVRLVLLTKMGLNKLEIAAMLNVTAAAVKKTRQRLNKKLGEQGKSLEDLLPVE